MISIRLLIPAAIFRFFPFIRPYMVPIFGCTVISLAAASSGALMPLTLKYVMDHVTAAEVSAFRPLRYLGLLGGVVMGLEVLRYIIDYAFARVSLSLEIDLRLRLLTRMLHKRISFFTDHHSTELVSMMYNDLYMAKQVPQRLIRLFLTKPVRTLFAFGTMCYLDFWLTAIVILSIPPIFVVLWWLRKMRRQITRAKLTAMDWITRDFHEFIVGAKLIKIWQMESECRRTLSEESHAYRAQSLKEVSFSFLINGFVSMITVGVLGGVFYVMAQRLNQGAPIGDYAGFLVALWFFFQSLIQIAVGYTGLIDVGVAVERLLGIFDGSEHDEPDSDLGQDVGPVESVAWDDVAFTRNGQTIAKSISLTLRPGVLHAVVGPNGAGKSTLVESLMGFVRPSHGRICINGIPLESLALGSLRKRISWVPQNAVLLHGSVRDNVWLTVSKSDQAALARYTEMSRITGLDDALARRGRTDADPVAERGENFSGGEKQRISLTRALVKPHDILILDEANVHITHQDFLGLMGHLRHLAKDRIVILITHNDRFIAPDDAVYEFTNQTLSLRASEA